MTNHERGLQNNTMKANAAGENDLQRLLDSMAPELMNGDYVFCSVKESNSSDYADANPIASFQEREGLSLVLLKESADRHALTYSNIYRCLTLGVHSSLDAVGLTAAVTTRLAENQISANVIAAYFHDHIFVPSDRADEALGLLSGMRIDRN